MFDSFVASHGGLFVLQRQVHRRGGIVWRWEVIKKRGSPTFTQYLPSKLPHDPHCHFSRWDIGRSHRRLAPCVFSAGDMMQHADMHFATNRCEMACWPSNHQLVAPAALWDEDTAATQRNRRDDADSFALNKQDSGCIRASTACQYCSIAPVIPEACRADGSLADMPQISTKPPGPHATLCHFRAPQ